MDNHQGAYTTERRDMMVRRVDEELSLAEERKRAREAEGDYEETNKRAKLLHDDTETTILQNGIVAPMQDALVNVGDSALSITTHMPQTTILSSAQSMSEVTTQLTDPGGDLAVFEPIPNLTGYNAPVHYEINWLPWINQSEA